MTFLDKLLGRADAEKKLREAARTLNGLLEEVGLEHKAMPDETGEKMTLTEEDLAAIVAKAMMDGLGENVPDNAEDIARAAAAEIVAAIAAVDGMAAEENAIADDTEVVQEERMLRTKMVKAFDVLFEENQALSRLVAEDNAAIVDAMEALKTLPASVEDLQKAVGELSNRVGVVQRQLSRTPRASLAPETEVTDPVEIKEVARSARKTHPLYGEVEVK